MINYNLVNNTLTCRFAKNKMTSHAERELKLVEEKIEKLNAKLLELKKKKRREGLSSDEEVDLEELDEGLKKLEADKKYWQEIIRESRFTSIC